MEKKEVVIYDVNAVAKKVYKQDAQITVSTADLLEKLGSIHSFEDSITLINEMSSLGKMQWTVTAMAVYKACSFTKTQKEAREMLQKHASKMGYSEAQMYNFKKAGSLLLKGLAEKTIPSFNDVPASIHEFLGQYKREKKSLEKQIFDCKIQSIIEQNDKVTFFLAILQDTKNEDRKGYAIIAAQNSDKEIMHDLSKEIAFLSCVPYTLKNAKGNEVEAYASEVGTEDGSISVNVEVAKMPLMN